MELEFHQMAMRYEGLRVSMPGFQARLMASLAEEGQLNPVLVVEREDEGGGYVLIDGYGVASLRGWGADFPALSGEHTQKIRAGGWMAAARFGGPSRYEPGRVVPSSSTIRKLGIPQTVLGSGTARVGAGDGAPGQALRRRGVEIPGPLVARQEI